MAELKSTDVSDQKTAIFVLTSTPTSLVFLSQIARLKMTMSVYNSRNISVSTMTKNRAGRPEFDSRQAQGLFCSAVHQINSEAHPLFYQNGFGSSSAGDKAH